MPLLRPVLKRLDSSGGTSSEHQCDLRYSDAQPLDRGEARFVLADILLAARDQYPAKPGGGPAMPARSRSEY